MQNYWLASNLLIVSMIKHRGSYFSNLHNLKIERYKCIIIVSKIWSSLASHNLSPSVPLESNESTYLLLTSVVIQDTHELFFCVSLWLAVETADLELTTSCMQQTISPKLQAINFTTSCTQQAAHNKQCHKLQSTNCKPIAANHKLQDTSCKQ